MPDVAAPSKFCAFLRVCTSHSEWRMGLPPRLLAFTFRLATCRFPARRFLAFFRSPEHFPLELRLFLGAIQIARLPSNRDLRNHDLLQAASHEVSGPFSTIKSLRPLQSSASHLASSEPQPFRGCCAFVFAVPPGLDALLRNDPLKMSLESALGVPCPSGSSRFDGGVVLSDFTIPS